MPSVTVHIDADECLEEISDETLRAEIDKRDKKSGRAESEAQRKARLERVYQDCRGMPNLPQSLRDFIWEELGRVL